MHRVFSSKTSWRFRLQMSALILSVAWGIAAMIATPINCNADIILTRKGVTQCSGQVSHCQYCFQRSDAEVFRSAVGSSLLSPTSSPIYSFVFCLSHRFCSFICQLRRNHRSRQRSRFDYLLLSSPSPTSSVSKDTQPPMSRCIPSQT
jgi:hypothetical protein